MVLNKVGWFVSPGEVGTAVGSVVGEFVAPSSVGAVVGNLVLEGLEDALAVDGDAVGQFVSPG